MPRPARSSSGSSRSSRGARSSSRSRTSQSSAVPLIAGIAGAIVVVAAVAFLASGNGGSQASSEQSQPAPANAAAPAPAATSAPAPDLSGGTERSGKTPDRPAPTIADADLAAAEAHYQRAKELWNDGQRARSSGDTATYTQAMDDAFDAMEQQRDSLRIYTDWYEEADLSDWAIPAEYVMLVRRLGDYDKLYQKIKKVKQIR